MLDRILLAAEGLEAKDSGIGRVARLMARVLSDEYPSDSWSSVTLNDKNLVRFRNEKSFSARGSRLKFVMQVQTQALRSRVVLYDSLSMGRAHRFGPVRDRPYLVWMHGIDVWEHARTAHMEVARRAEILVSNTHYTRDRASALRNGLDHAHVCWLGTETDDMPSMQTITDDTPPTALLLARIDKNSYKGHFELIRCWPEVVAAVPGARLRLAGSGSGFDQISEVVRASRVASQIDLLGYVPEDKLETAWRGVHTLVMPSRGEGFGLVYIEAMRRGIPVIASVHDAGREINVHGVTGYNVDQDNQGELTTAIVSLLTDQQRAAQFGASGQRRWHEHFTYSAFRSRFLPILRKALEGVERQRS